MIKTLQTDQTCSENLKFQLLYGMMHPHSVAIIGASEKEGSVGYQVLMNVVTGGFHGDVFLVNPKYAGQKSWASTLQKPLAYLASADNLPPDVIDLSVVVTPSHTVAGILMSLIQKKVKSVVILTSGFQEIGSHGEALTEQLMQIINSNPIVVVGPNCVGITNSDPQVMLNATFAPSAPLFGHGAMFSQSGAVGIDIMNHARQIGLGFSQFVSIGNTIQIGPEDLLAYWQSAPGIRYVVGYVESGKSLCHLRNLLLRMTKTKPVILIKAGSSQVGAKAAGSHTGAMAGHDEAVNALFTQTGVHRAYSIQELFAAAQAFEYGKPSVGNRVAIFSNAGGYGVMASDQLDSKFFRAHGLVMPPFSPETTQKLETLLPTTASISNPIDTTAALPFQDLAAYQAALETVLQDPNIDACLVLLVMVLSEYPQKLLKALSEIQQRTEKPIVAVVYLSEHDLKACLDDIYAQNQSPIPIYPALEDAILGLSALEKHRLWKMKPVGELVHFSDTDIEQAGTIIQHARKEKRLILTAFESLAILKAYKIPTPNSTLVVSLEDALAQANAMGYPVAIKLNSKTIIHKTDVGGVQLDIRNEVDLKQAYQAIQSSLKQANLPSAFAEGEGILVQKFVSKGREVILGVKDDEDFGKMLMVGRGGIYTQIDQDVAFFLNPLTREDAKDMIREIKAYQILKGYRGKPGVDIEALEDAILRLSQLVIDFPEINEIDINPYLALPKSENSDVQSVAVDSRIILKP